MTRPLIVGNWKMNKTPSEGVAFVRALAQQLKSAAVDVVLAVPFPAIEPCVVAAAGSPIAIGAQNGHDAPAGAFTGEVSMRMVRQLGARYVLIGHSERRTLFGETGDVIHRKVVSALSEGLIPILCVGENLAEREAGEHKRVVAEQLTRALQGLNSEKLFIAYEPVWAIGTGKTATPESAQEMHALIGQQVPGARAVLYGGSVQPETARALMQQPRIGGLLVGGASLQVETLMRIVEGATT